MNINEASVQNEMLTIANEHKIEGSGAEHFSCFLLICRKLQATKIEAQFQVLEYYPKNASAFRQKLEALRNPSATRSRGVALSARYLSPGEGKVSHANVA